MSSKKNEKNNEQKENMNEEINNEEQEVLNNKEAEEQQPEQNDELAERVKELEEKNQELNDRLLRRIAEFENYKRRTEQDQINLLNYAAEPFIIKILPVYDDLHRSLDHIDDDNNNQSVKDGLKMVFDKFTKALQDQGVEKIKSKGETFDFNLHEALLRQVSADTPADTVLEEVEPGYKYKDKVIKHAKVIVSQEPEEDNSGTGDADEK